MSSVRPLWVACGLTVLGALSSAGCGASYSDLASRYARAEGATARAIRPFGDLPFRACRKFAAYQYMDEALNGLPPSPATGQPWPNWYASAPYLRSPKGSVTWQAECEITKHVGGDASAVVKGLRLHAHAVAALTEGTPFDASGLSNVGSAAGSAGTALGQSAGYSKTASNAGDALASATKTFVTLYEQKKLKEAFAAEEDCMQKAFADLRSLAKTLGEMVTRADTLREDVVGRLVTERRKAPSSPLVALVDAYQFVGDDDVELQELREELANDQDAIEKLATAHAKLAALAQSQASAADVDKALADLEKITDQLLDTQR